MENTTSSGQSAEELINNEKCTAALDDSGTPTSLQSVSYSDTTWALLFNCDSIFASTELRQALAVQPLRRWKSLAAGCSRRQRASSPTA